MNATIEHINRLLGEGGSVAVPGLGVFVSTPVSADYSDVSGIVAAPHARIVYERCDDVDDSRLAASVMRRDEIGPESARALIAADVEAIKAALEADGEVSLGSVGSLVADVDGDVKFVQSAHFVDYTGGAWLHPLRLEALEADIAAEAPASAQAATLSRAWLRWAGTTAAAVIVFGVVALITVFSNRFMGTADLGTSVAAGMIAPAPSPALSIVDGAPVGVAGSLVLILNTPADGAQPVEPRPTASSELVPDAYCLIVASLASEAEAQAFCREHSTERIPLGVLPVDGRYRVYAASAPTMPEVLAIAADRGIRDVYASSWVCRN